MTTAIRHLLLLTIIVFSVFYTDGYGAYQLVWSDEFNGPNIDTSIWTHEIGNGTNGWGNNEWQYYTDHSDNSYIDVANDDLVIVARKDHLGHDYTSARMKTQNKQTFLYGRMEARIKLPAGGNGMWPAFWMLGNNIGSVGWPECGEIDILEAVNDFTEVVGALHYGSGNPYNHDYESVHYNPGLDVSADYHVYAVEWEPTEIRWYFDGFNYFTKTDWWNSDPYPAPFDKPFFFLLNIAVGGNWPGYPDASTPFPQTMYIDYVRVYQESSNIVPTVAITSPSNGAILPAGNIVIDATASDSDGSVATVEFYEGANYLGEDTTSPYSFTWTSVPDGCYTITAKAVDDVGGSGTDSIDIEVGAGCPQTPYYGDPMTIPGQIEAEDFDLGGEGSAYHDSDVGNTGGQYRSEDVDIEVCADTGGGHNLGWIRADEWLEYTVDVATTGNYAIETRVASLTTGGGFHVEFDGVDKTGPVTVPSTGDWQNWTTVSASVNLSAGVQIMRFVRNSVAGDEYNLNYFNISSSDGFANADIDISGTRVGSYSDTRVSDDAYEELTEVESGGNPNNRYSYLEHKWTFSVAAGDTVIFYVEAHHTSNTEGDDFVFAYSTDDSAYTNMLTVTKTSDDDTTQSYVLPSSLSGTVYIRVQDIDQSAGNKVLDTLYVDRMYIDSQSSTATVPDVLGMDQVSAQSAITTAGLSVGVIGQSFSNSVAAGNVMSQTPGGGTSVPPGSSVDLEISLGIRGDLDVDGTVDIVDVGIMASEWLSSPVLADIEPAAGDGAVNLQDFAVLASNWGQSI